MFSSFYDLIFYHSIAFLLMYLTLCHSHTLTLSHCAYHYLSDYHSLSMILSCSHTTSLSYYAHQSHFLSLSHTHTHTLSLSLALILLLRPPNTLSLSFYDTLSWLGPWKPTRPRFCTLLHNQVPRKANYVLQKFTLNQTVKNLCGNSS